MEAEEIRKIRKALGLTQEGMAQLLGVTKVSVARYEAGTIRPQGDSERKLRQLAAFMQKEDEGEQVRKLLLKGGAASLAALLAVSSVAGVTTLAALMASPAITALGVMAALFRKKD